MLDFIMTASGWTNRCPRKPGAAQKERCTPLTTQTVKVLKAWIREPARDSSDILFPTVHGQRLSADAVQYLIAKYTEIARNSCFSLKKKRVTPHMARHTAAME